MTALPKNSRDVAGLIDHTLLKPEATSHDVERVCREAIQFHFSSVCVNPVFVPQVAAALRSTDVKTCSVVGFPLGVNRSITKVYEARAALDDGALELDMVINIGALKARDDVAVKGEIANLAAICHERQAILKVIIETCLLSEEEKIRSCALAKDAGADFVKTSTGFNSAGATVEDVRLMREAVGPEIGVKASGGVRSLDDLLKMVEAGASRIGSSSGVKIVEQALVRFGT